VIEHLLCKCEALSSNLNLIKKKKMQKNLKSDSDSQSFLTSPCGKCLAPAML
jgi:hypothetical protein